MLRKKKLAYFTLLLFIDMKEYKDSSVVSDNYLQFLFSYETGNTLSPVWKREWF